MSPALFSSARSPCLTLMSLLDFAHQYRIAFVNPQPAGRLFFVAEILLLSAAMLTRPSSSRAQGEATEVRRMFKGCTDSGGVAATDYQDWVNQNGCKCSVSSVGSGKVTCDASTVSTGSNAANPMVAFMQTLQKALEEARARQAAERVRGESLNAISPNNEPCNGEKRRRK